MRNQRVAEHRESTFCGIPIAVPHIHRLIYKGDVSKLTAYVNQLATMGIVDDIICYEYASCRFESPLKMAVVRSRTDIVQLAG